MNWMQRVSNFLNVIDNLMNFTYFDAIDFIKTRDDLNDIINGHVQLSPLTNIDQYNHSGLQPLHYAIETKNSLAIEWLLSHENVLFNSLTEIQNWNSAHCAVRADDSDTFNKLIQVGVDLNAIDSYRLTPLAYAESDLNSGSWIQYLEMNSLNFNIRLGTNRRTYFHYFSKDSTKLLLDYVIKMKIDDINSGDVEGITPLMLAAESGQLESIVKLLSNGAKLDILDEKGRSALHLAAEAGQFKACQLIICNSDSILADQGIDSDDFIDFYDSSDEGDAAQELLLIQDHKDLTPLMLAVLHGHTETVRILAKENSKHLDLKQRQSGDTALHLAVSFNSPEIVAILLEAGAYPDSINNSGKKPIDLSARDSEIFELLAESVIVV